MTFAAGTTEISFDIKIINDKILENKETFMLTIHSSLSTGTIDQATVTIVDDDGK